MDTVDESLRAICVEAVYNLSAGNLKDVSEDILDSIGQLPCSGSPYYVVLNGLLKVLDGDPILSMLDIESEILTEAFNTISRENCSSKVKLSS